MERSEDGEWLRWDDALAMADRVRLEHDEWDKRRIAELQGLRLRHHELTTALLALKTEMEQDWRSRTFADALTVKAWVDKLGALLKETQTREPCAGRMVPNGRASNNTAVRENVIVGRGNLLDKTTISGV